MNEELKRLAMARRVRDEYLQEIAEIEEIIQSKGLWKRLLRKKDLLKIAKADVTDAEDALRKAGLKEHKKTGETKLPGGNIAKVKDYIFDEDKALEWGIKKKLAISFNRAGFLKIYKSGETDIDFVTVKENPSFRIDSDLSKFDPFNTEANTDADSENN
jgi:hypothetical protein